MSKGSKNTQAKLNKTKKIVLTIVTILCILIVVAIWLLFGADRPEKPKVKSAEFPFELVYEYNNEQFTIKESIVCEYEGIEWSLDGGNRREWNCYITNNNEWGQYYLDRQKYPTLHIQIPLNADYYMGDPKADVEFATPYIFFIDDSTGTTYYEQDLTEVVGAKIISWTPSDVLVGNIKK